MIGYIYKTTNLINRKVYIGKHECSEYDPSYLGSGKLLKRAIKKYGKVNFINEIIYRANTIDELNAAEIKYIEQYKKNSYNIAKGGDGGNTLRYKTDDEIQDFKDKMTIINRQRCNTDEFKNKISQANKIRYSNLEAREIQSKKVKDGYAQMSHEKSKI